MWPVLQIGPAALPTYPFSLLVGLWLGLWVSAREARRVGLDDDHVYNAGLFGLVAGVLGARLWFVVGHWEAYAGDLTQALALNVTALAITEGLITALIVVLIYLLRHRLPLATFADVAAPGLALLLAVNGLGAFLAGVGPGLPADVPWAVPIFDARRHPVQLYNLLGSLAILGVLFWRRTRKPWPGFNFWLFVALYSGLRLFTEAFRVATPDVITGGGFRLNQLVAWLALLVALVVMAWRGRAAAGAEGEAESLPQPSSTRGG